MVFIDKITMTQRFLRDSIPQLCGLRTILYREAGDIDREGKTVVETEAVGESLKTAWVKGSHNTALQLRSDGTTLSIKGNPGRFGRPDNLFNLDLSETIDRANAIVQAQGFPARAFHKGHPLEFSRSQLEKMGFAKEQIAEIQRLPDAKESPEKQWSGARVWEIHLTQNFVTGSPENVKRVVDWANTQTVSRVKKSRLGATTVVWGNLKYCQTELYGKAEEMLAHCKSKEEKEAMKQSEAYKWALANGVVRLEIKCAKDFLRERKLTYLGNWDMGTVTALFEEKSEILRRCALVKDQDEADILAALEPKYRVTAAAWMQGIDLTTLMSRATLYRHAKVLREYGMDIMEKRNVAVLRPKMSEVTISACALPDWYSLQAA